MADAVEREFLATPVAAAGGRVIVSPFQFLTTSDDGLRIEGWSSVINVVLVVQGQRWSADKGLHEFSHKVPLSSDRLVTETDVPLGAGYLVNLIAFVEGAAPVTGQVFCSVKLIRGLTGATLLIGALLQGYLTDRQVLAWPGSPLMGSDSGEGALLAIAGTNPAPGNEITETVPTGAQWEILMLRCLFDTDATVATRYATLVFGGGASIAFVVAAADTQVASQTKSYAWGQACSLVALAGQGEVTQALPVGARRRGGDVLRTGTGSLQAGDDWRTPVFSVREWLEAA